MYAHPGKKLMFMGDEFGQTARVEPRHRRSTGICSSQPLHSGLQRFVRDLNHVYAAEPALHQVDFDPAGFQWIDCNDSENSVVSFIRRAKSADDFVVAVLNFTPVPRDELSHRRAGRRHVHGSRQQRRQLLRRQQRRQRRIGGQPSRSPLTATCSRSTCACRRSDFCC